MTTLLITYQGANLFIADVIILLHYVRLDIIESRVNARIASMITEQMNPYRFYGSL